MGRTAAPVLRTWTAGEVPLGQYLNSLRDALAYLLSPPQCEVYQAVTQNIGSAATPASGNAITFDSEVMDSDGMHSTTTNTTRVVAPLADEYDIVGGVSFAGNGTGRRGGQWAINGALVANTLTFHSSGSTSALSVPMRSTRQFFNAGDYVELWAAQDSGSTLATGTGPNGSYLGLFRASS
jgi:hypothetical protein